MKYLTQKEAAFESKQNGNALSEYFLKQGTFVCGTIDRATVINVFRVFLKVHCKLHELLCSDI